MPTFHQEVQSNKELCRLLATRITQILDILQTQTADFEEDSIPVSIATSVQQFTRSLFWILLSASASESAISERVEISTVSYHMWPNFPSRALCTNSFAGTAFNEHLRDL